MLGFAAAIKFIFHFCWIEPGLFCPQINWVIFLQNQS
jgi:hypothetical protein